MKSRWRALLVLIVFMLASGLSPARSEADDPPAGERGRAGGAVHSPASTAESNAGDAAYWTPERMAAAEPRDAMVIGDDGVIEYGAESAPRGGPGSAIRVVRPYRNQPDRMVGKVFGSDSQGDYHCSGAVVQAGNRSVVMTAGHCVFNTNTGQWANRVVFVPAYGSTGQGTRPYGLWSDYNLWSHVEWTQYGNYEVDVGAIVIQPRNGQRIQNVVGAHRIGFGQPVSGAFRPWGYPAQAPFTGWDQWYCAGPVAGRDVDDGFGPPTIGVRCNLTPGSSGGPWLRAIAANGIGTVSSVTSYRYAGSEILFGPYFGAMARVVYNGAASDS